MPFGVYFAEDKPKLPEDKAERTRELFRIRFRLEEDYGARYGEINEALAEARKWHEEQPTDVVKNVVDQVAQMRTDIVLYFKSLIKRTEFLINELVPGAYPSGDQDGPMESIDADEVFQLGASLVAAGAIIGGLSGWTGGGAVVGGIVGGTGALMMGGAAVYGMIYD